MKYEDLKQHADEMVDVLAESINPNEPALKALQNIWREAYKRGFEAGKSTESRGPSGDAPDGGWLTP